MASAGLIGSPIIATGAGRIRAVAFDVFTIFDVSSVDAIAETQFRGHRKELAALWKSKLFDYFWLRTLNARYADCHEVAADALRFACSLKGLEATPDMIEMTVGIFSRLKIWPDSTEALKLIHNHGLRLAYLSNLTEAMLKSSSNGAGIAPLFERWLSTDRVHALKPGPRSYAMAESAFALERSQVLFATTGGWDYAGAKSFGLETFWVNRSRAPREDLGVQPDREGRTLADHANYAIARARKSRMS